MGPLWSARFVAKVLGNPAVMVAAILAFPWLVQIVITPDIPNWLRLLILLLYVPILLSVGWRLCRGGEQGPTDVVVTEAATATTTSRTIVIGNLPLAHAPTELPRAMETFAQMTPIPRPWGRVKGNPSQAAALVPDSHAALPDNAPVADEPLAIPPEAKGLATPPEPPREKAPTEGEAPKK